MIYGCGNTGEVRGASASGIVYRSGKTSTIDSCWNQGTICGTHDDAAGITAVNQGWLYDCYNAGNIQGNVLYMSGIVGRNYSSSFYKKNIYNCYNIGQLVGSGRWEDIICGDGESGNIKNTYSLPSERNSYASEITLEEFKTPEAITKLQGENVISKWCIDKDNLNGGCIILTAQQDMKDGTYKMLPDVWNPITKVSIDIEEGSYKLQPYSYIYYGLETVEAVYSSDSDILFITSDGVITPLKPGTAIVRVMFEETEHAKAEGFDVEVNITGTARALGDILRWRILMGMES